MENADIRGGEKYPYNNKPHRDRAELVVQGILYNLCDRRGIKQELLACDDGVRDEIVTTLSDIVRSVFFEVEVEQLNEITQIRKDLEELKCVVFRNLRGE